MSSTSKAARRAAREKLRGHSTAANWLPEGLWTELDELRAEHLRVREQVAAELTALEALDARFRAEDKQHERAMQQAHREGRPDSAIDRRSERRARSGCRRG